MAAGDPGGFCSSQGEGNSDRTPDFRLVNTYVTAVSVFSIFSYVCFQIVLVSSALKVFVIAHVPVGYLPWARDTTAIREIHNEQLVSIFRKYSDIIAGQFYGHTHRDSIMVLQDEQGWFEEQEVK